MHVALAPHLLNKELRINIEASVLHQIFLTVDKYGDRPPRLIIIHVDLVVIRVPLDHAQRDPLLRLILLIYQSQLVNRLLRGELPRLSCLAIQLKVKLLLADAIFRLQCRVLSFLI